MVARSRVVVLYATDTDAAEDVRALLSLANGERPLHPPADGRVAGPQAPWSDEEVARYVETLLDRLRGKVEIAASLIGPS